MNSPLVIINRAALPEAIKAGEELVVQLAPFGDFPAIVNGKTVVQHCDRAAFDRIVANFREEVLVDFEHGSATGGPTTAAAWVQALNVDPEKGLMAVFKFTDVGAEAVSTRRLRFLSPAWQLDREGGRPARLVSVGLTNKPNLPVRPMLNREEPGIATVEQPETQEPNKMKEQLIALLGLAADAEDAAVIEAVTALTQKVKEAEDAALNEEAEKAADECGERIANREAFKALYVQNREAAKAFVATLAPKATQPTAKVTVCNRAAAMAPGALSQKSDADQALKEKWEAMPRGADKDAFLVRNRAAIQRACDLALNKD